MNQARNPKKKLSKKKTGGKTNGEWDSNEIARIPLSPSKNGNGISSFYSIVSNHITEDTSNKDEPSEEELRMRSYQIGLLH